MNSIIKDFEKIRELIADAHTAKKKFVFRKRSSMNDSSIVRKGHWFLSIP
jgi:hypothetical protein